MSFNVPTLNGNAIPNPAAPPTPYFGANAAPVGQLIGGGLSTLGAQMKATADKAKALGDAVAARKKVTELRQYAINAIHGEGGLTALSGEELFAAAKDFEGTFGEQRAELMQGLTPDQQPLFDEQADTVGLGVSDDVSRIVMAGTKKYVADTYANDQSGVRQTRYASVANGALSLVPAKNATYQAGQEPPLGVRDPMIGSNLAYIDAGVAEWASASRASPEDAKIVGEEAHGAFHETTIEALLTPDESGHIQWKTAQLYWKEWKGDVANDKLRDALAAKVDNAVTVGTVDKESRKSFVDVMQRDITWAERRDVGVKQLDRVPLAYRADSEARFRQLVVQAESDETTGQADALSAVKSQIEQPDANIMAIKGSGLWERMSPDGRTAAAAYYNNRLRGHQTVTDPLVRTALMESTPDELARVNVDELVMNGELDSQTAADIVAIKEKLAKGAGDDYRTVGGVVTERAEEMHPGSAQVRRNERGEFYRKVAAVQRVWIANNPGKEMLPHEMEEVLDAITADTVLKPGQTMFGIDWLNRDDTGTIESVASEADLQSIAERLAELGQPFTSENVAIAFRALEESRGQR